MSEKQQNDFHLVHTSGVMTRQVYKTSLKFQIRIISFSILALLVTLIGISGCATKKLYYGVEATDLSGLFIGMERPDVERITGSATKVFECDSGSIVTYLYDRGWTGCVGEGTCKSEDESKLQTMEIVADVFSVGMFSGALNMCIEPCQKGHLEVLYNDQNGLVGVVEHPTFRYGHCWNKWNTAQEGYPCNRIYENRRPSSVPSQLLLYIDSMVRPDQICDKLMK